MVLYGLMGFSHGGASLMIVMGPEGRQAVIDHLEFDPAKLHVLASTTGLPQYHQMVDGGLDDLIARYGIQVLDFQTWTRKKVELGANAYR